MTIQITKEQLSDLYVSQNKTDAEIAEIYNCKYWNISRLRRSLGIRGINARQREFLKREPMEDLTPRQMSIIIGTILGDGCLKNSGPRAYLSISHCAKQHDYILWLKKELDSIIKSEIKESLQHGKYKAYSMNSETRFDLRELKDKIYLPIKIVTSIFETINALALSVWYMDDGCLSYVNKSRSQYIFATNGFSQNDLYKLKQIIYNNFGIETEVKPISRASGIQFVLCVSDISFDLFTQVVKPHIIPSMTYKLAGNKTLRAESNNVDKLALEDMYCVQKMTQPQIARAMGVSVSLVRKRMMMFDIPTRSTSEAQLNGKNSRITRKSDGTFKAYELNRKDYETVEKLFSEIRQTGIEPKKIDIQHGIGIIDHITALDLNKFLCDDGFNYCRTGMNLCSSFFPHTLDMASIGSLSQREIFMDDTMLRDCIERTLKYAKKTSISAVRHGLKTYKNNRSVTFFPPAWAKFIIENEFKNQDQLKVLDFSSGFGGRLIGSYASRKVSKYIGIDPLDLNINSTRKLYEIIEKHASLSNIDFNMSLYCNTAENVLPKLDEKVDLILTSPPYFDKERYSKKNTQCYVKFSKYNQWVDGWLKPILKQSFSLLKSGGKMIIFASNWGKNPVGDSCHDIMQELTGNDICQTKFILPSVEYLRKNPSKRYDTVWIAKK